MQPSFISALVFVSTVDALQEYSHEFLLDPITAGNLYHCLQKLLVNKRWHEERIQGMMSGKMSKMRRRGSRYRTDWHNVHAVCVDHRACIILYSYNVGQRLRQAQNETSISTSRLPQTQRPESSTNDTSSEIAIRSSPDDIAHLNTSRSPCPHFQNVEAHSSALELDLTCNPYPQTCSIPSPLAQTIIPLTVFAALYANGDIQGISCATTYSSRTPMPKPHIPLPLHPTELQMMIVHPRWIDRLPFPRMRDSLIKLIGVVDEEELCKDLFTMPSWAIEPGYASWDPRAWKMEREWEMKWGWLMI